MPQPRNKAVVAGLAVTLALGGVALPAVANTEQTPATDSDPDGMGLPAPAAYDKDDFYEGTEGVATFAHARSASSLTPVSLSDEMKYFAKYESNCNYDQGLSYGDGYNAMGYYQFDRRYSLLPFIQQVYDYNPTKYGMFATPLAQRDVLSDRAVSLYDSTTRQLTAPAQALNDAWHAAYAADPAEFSALQDSYAYNNYYLPVQSMLQNTYGVDVRDRADCVKGLVWGMCNLFGQGGVQNYLRDANLNNNMTDRELVVALCDTVIDRVTYYCSSQPQYWEGWQNRYRKEKAQCLKFLDQHEAEQNIAPLPTPQPQAPQQSSPKPEAAPGPEARPEVKPEAMPEVKPEEKPEPKPDPKPEPKPESKPQAPLAPDSKPESKPEFVPGKPAPESGDSGTQAPSPEPQPQVKPNTQAPSAGPDARPNAEQERPGTDASAGNNGGATSGDSSNKADGDNVSDGKGSAGSTDDEGASSNTTDNSVSKKDEHNKDAGDSMNTLGTSAKNKDAGAKVTQTSAQACGAQANAAKAGLPETGDVAAMVLTGAAGLAAAGASFLSLAKKERTCADDAAGAHDGEASGE